MNNQNNLCPCDANKVYAKCCEKFHNNTENPKTALELMRSRYSAYVLNNIDYIVVTTLPKQQSFLDIKAMKEWAKTTKWCGLKIISHKAKPYLNKATVEFIAYFETEQGKGEHHELSLFLYQNHQWYFVDPNV